ncbi:MAG: thioredoxin domain-containing protein [Rhodoglobus sp.]
MSYGSSGNDGISKNDRREAAREKARILRDEQKKKDRRSRVLLQGGVILASIAIIVIIGLVIVSSVKPEGPGPQNMASDGIQISQGGVALKTPALKTGEAPIANKPDTSTGVLNIQMYVDYLCPICGDFEKTNGDYITSLLDNGGATVEIHPLAILDRLSQGTRYSTRAANAAACVANYSPSEYYDFHTLLFAKQPGENTTGRTDDELIGYADQVKVKNASKIDSCIRNQDFKAWVEASTARALNGPIPNSNVDKVQGTPTVIVNGLKYGGSENDLAAFQAFVVQAEGDTFNQSSTSTPTPTPTPAG